jgi:hypothetical protein
VLARGELAIPTRVGGLDDIAPTIVGLPQLQLQPRNREAFVIIIIVVVVVVIMVPYTLGQASRDCSKLVYLWRWFSTS